MLRQQNRYHLGLGSGGEHRPELVGGGTGPSMLGCKRGWLTSRSKCERCDLLESRGRVHGHTETLIHRDQKSVISIF